MAKCRKYFHINLKSYFFLLPSGSSGTCARICMNALLQNSLSKKCKKRKLRQKLGVQMLVHQGVTALWQWGVQSLRSLPAETQHKTASGPGTSLFLQHKREEAQPELSSADSTHQGHYTCCEVADRLTDEHVNPLGFVFPLNADKEDRNSGQHDDHPKTTDHGLRVQTEAQQDGPEDQVADRDQDVNLTKNNKNKFDPTLASSVFFENLNVLYRKNLQGNSFMHF